jgi:hypothetical protein
VLPPTLVKGSRTRQIRVRVRFFDFLTTQIVRLTNRQLAVLLRYFPAAADLFSGLNTLIAQHFQPVEKVSENLCQISPNSSLQKQKNSITCV